MDTEVVGFLLCSTFEFLGMDSRGFCTVGVGLCVVCFCTLHLHFVGRMAVAVLNFPCFFLLNIVMVINLWET